MNYLELKIDEYLNLSVQINWIVILVFIPIIFTILLIKIINNKNKHWEIDEAELGIGNQKLKLKVNNNDIQIAYKIWAELSTRKLGVKIDTEKDVIVEVYNSWYQFFGIVRELIKNIPVSKINQKTTKQIIQLSIDILNKSVRPHLTQWQAIFRKWYEEEYKKESKKYLSPQQIQKKFSQYEELVNGMLEVNKNLVCYCELMQKIVMKDNNKS